MTGAQRQTANEVREKRKTLFDDGAMKQRRRQTTSSSSSTAMEAASIQNSLTRTQHLLKSELSRTNQLNTAIEDDGKVLNDTLNTHQTMDVSKAKKALTKLQLAQQREQRVLMAAIIFFWTVVFYILFVRVIMHIPFVDSLIASIRFW